MNRRQCHRGVRTLLRSDRKDFQHFRIISFSSFLARPQKMASVDFLVLCFKGFGEGSNPCWGILSTSAIKNVSRKTFFEKIRAFDVFQRPRALSTSPGDSLRKNRPSLSPSGPTAFSTSPGDSLRKNCPSPSPSGLEPSPYPYPASRQLEKFYNLNFFDIFFAQNHVLTVLKQF